MRTSTAGQGRAMRSPSCWDVAVVGGGPAGCMAALAAAGAGASVLLLERNPKLGRKLYITGKGRCNVTNDCAPREVLEHVPRNGRFLTSAVTRFPPEAVKEFLPMQPGDVYQTNADVTRLERDMGYKPSMPLEEGVRRFVEWYRGFYGE